MLIASGMIGTLLALSGVLVVQIQKMRTLIRGKKKKYKKRFKIAIVMVAPNATVRHIIRGFTSHLRRYATFQFEIITCDARGNTTAIASFLQQCLERNFDLIFCLGKRVTEQAVHIMRTSNKQIPLVSGGIPVETLKEPLESFRKYAEITGTTSSFEWPERIAALAAAYPDMKRALVLNLAMHQLTRINMREKNIISGALRQHKVEAVMHHITDIRKSCELSETILKDIDIVIISRDALLLSHAPFISKVCAQYGMPVFTPEEPYENQCLLGSTKSSSLSKQIGANCGKQTLKIIDKKISPNEIPFAPLLSSREQGGIETGFNLSLHKTINTRTSKKLTSSVINSGTRVSIIVKTN